MPETVHRLQKIYKTEFWKYLRQKKNTVAAEKSKNYFSIDKENFVKEGSKTLTDYFTRRYFRNKYSRNWNFLEKRRKQQNKRHMIQVFFNLLQTTMAISYLMHIIFDKKLLESKTYFILQASRSVSQSVSQLCDELLHLQPCS